LTGQNNGKEILGHGDDAGMDSAGSNKPIAAIGIVVAASPDSIMQARKGLTYLGITELRHPTYALLDAISRSMVGLGDVYAVAISKPTSDSVSITTITGLERNVIRAAKSLRGARCAWVTPVDAHARLIISDALEQVVARMEVV
jgi:hypothetical protein